MNSIRSIFSRVFNDPLGKGFNDLKAALIDRICRGANRTEVAELRGRLTKMSGEKIIGEYGNAFIDFVVSDSDAQALLWKLGLPHQALVRGLFERHGDYLIRRLFNSDDEKTRQAALGLVLDLSSDTSALQELRMDGDGSAQMERLKTAGLRTFRSLPDWFRELFLCNRMDMAVELFGYHREGAVAISLLLASAPPPVREQFLLLQADKIFNTLQSAFGGPLIEVLTRLIAAFVPSMRSTPEEEAVRNRQCWSEMLSACSAMDILMDWLPECSQATLARLTLTHFEGLNFCMLLWSEASSAGLHDDREARESAGKGKRERVAQVEILLLDSLNLEDRIPFMCNEKNSDMLNLIIGNADYPRDIARACAAYLLSLGASDIFFCLGKNQKFSELLFAMLRSEEFGADCLALLTSFSAEERRQFVHMQARKFFQFLRDGPLADGASRLLLDLSTGELRRLFWDLSRGDGPLGRCDFFEIVFSVANRELRAVLLGFLCGGELSQRRQLLAEGGSEFCSCLLGSREPEVGEMAVQFLRTFPKRFRQDFAATNGEKFFPKGLAAPYPSVREFVLKIFQSFPSDARRTFLARGELLTEVEFHSDSLGTDPTVWEYLVNQHLELAVPIGPDAEPEDAAENALFHWLYGAGNADGCLFPGVLIGSWLYGRCVGCFAWIMALMLGGFKFGSFGRERNMLKDLEEAEGQAAMIPVSAEMRLVLLNFLEKVPAEDLVPIFQVIFQKFHDNSPSAVTFMEALMASLPRREMVEALQERLSTEERLLWNGAVGRASLDGRMAAYLTFPCPLAMATEEEAEPSQPPPVGPVTFEAKEIEAGPPVAQATPTARRRSSSCSPA
ncbi:MAG: hypothetical protein LBB14_02410 [Puniceicoccales bacterium]|nr:hypothetical protein [Puniceicoccales bacterium]